VSVLKYLMAQTVIAKVYATFQISEAHISYIYIQNWVCLYQVMLKKEKKLNVTTAWKNS